MTMVGELVPCRIPLLQDRKRMSSIKGASTPEQHQHVSTYFERQERAREKKEGTARALGAVLAF